MKSKMIFKTTSQAGNVCRLLNDISDADYEKRYYHFYRKKKTLFYEINTQQEQKKLEREIKDFKKRCKKKERKLA